MLITITFKTLRRFRPIKILGNVVGVIRLLNRNILIFISFVSLFFLQGCTNTSNHHKIRHLSCEIHKDTVTSEFEIVSGEKLSAVLEGDQLVFKNQSVVKVFPMVDAKAIIIRTYREPEYYHVDMTFHDDPHLYIFGLLTGDCRDVLLDRMKGVEVHIL